MTELSYLAHLPEHDYERERSRLINEAINASPELYREGLRQQQRMIDAVPRNERIKQIVSCMSEALENLSDQIQAFKNLQR